MRMTIKKKTHKQTKHRRVPRCSECFKRVPDKDFRMHQLRGECPAVETPKKDRNLEVGVQRTNNAAAYLPGKEYWS